jgi:hypothetical protein
MFPPEALQPKGGLGIGKTDEAKSMNNNELYEKYKPSPALRIEVRATAE